MAVFFSITGMAWALYSALTIYGTLEFPAYSASEKANAIAKILCVPFLGAYWINRDMGHRIDDAARVDLFYELPWWAGVGLRVVRGDLDDD